RLETLRRQLEALGPRRVLERGFAIVRLADGRVVRGPQAAPRGTALSLILAEGGLQARSEGAAENGAAGKEGGR
ncbi:MAG: exodeoxyribonuclease VII large subunit, partial [Candidatus Eisenbacteria bacterium]|nr:exodeoxyribonuclease VII large subunit [Candidatus Eisenbacteria bacterium]